MKRIIVFLIKKVAGILIKMACDSKDDVIRYLIKKYFEGNHLHKNPEKKPKEPTGTERALTTP